MNPNFMTALEAVKRDGNTPEQRRIIEALAKTNEILLDMPVFEANDKTGIANNVFVKGTQPATTYYTYTMKLTLDGATYDFGQIKLVNTEDSGDVYKLTSSVEVGTYTIILTSEKTFNVYVGNQKLLNIPAPTKSKMLKAAPAGSTPITLIFGFISFASVDTPAARPPPPIGTRI